MAGCSQPGHQKADCPASPSRPQSLTILHTNDWHGYAFGVASSKGGAFGGVAAAAAAIERIRSEQPDQVLVLDAGDLLSGHPASLLPDDQGHVGVPFVKFWNAIGYDALALGNHEFDKGQANLAAVLTHIRADVLCANVISAGTKTPILKAAPYKIYTRGGLRVAVIGGMTSDLPGLVSSSSLAGTDVLSPVETIKRLVAELAPITDVQIALTHCGIQEDKQIAQAAPELEAIIGGHSHSRLAEPIAVGNVLIVQAGSHGRELGRLDLTMQGGRRSTFTYTLLPLPVPTEAEATVAIRAVLETESTLKRILEPLEREVIGTLAATFTRNHYEDSALGGAVAEALRVAAGTDIGFVNSGGLRTDLAAGPVSRAQLMQTFPFGNMVARFETDGATLTRMLEHNAAAMRSQDHGVLQSAGLSCSYKLEAGQSVVTDIKVGGKPIDPKRTYTCATNDYVARSLPQRYLGVPQLVNVKVLAITVRDAVEQAIRAQRFKALAKPRFTNTAPTNIAPTESAPAKRTSMRSRAGHRSIHAAEAL